MKLLSKLQAFEYVWDLWGREWLESAAEKLSDGCVWTSSRGGENIKSLASLALVTIKHNFEFVDFFLSRNIRRQTLWKSLIHPWDGGSVRGLFEQIKPLYLASSSSQAHTRILDSSLTDAWCMKLRNFLSDVFNRFEGRLSFFSVIPCLFWISKFKVKTFY